MGFNFIFLAQNIKGVFKMEIEKMSVKELLELKDKIQRREREIEDEKVNKELEKAKEFLNSIDPKPYLNLMEHSKHSCSDKHPRNGYDSSKGWAECNKCHFIEILEDHKVGINEFSIDVRFEFTKLI